MKSLRFRQVSLPGAATSFGRKAFPALWAGLLLLYPPCLVAQAQERSDRAAAILQSRSKDSPAVLRVFAPISKASKDSIVQFEVDDKEAALGTVVDASGWVMSKASEIGAGKLTCKLANGSVVPAEITAIDDQNDLALVRIQSKDLKPIVWSAQPVIVGQWAVTPGIDAAPEAVGIVSSLPRKIMPKQAFIGVRLDFNADKARIAAITPGLGADKAGLKAGDNILKINDVAVTNSLDLASQLKNFGEGQLVTLHVERENKEWDASVAMSSIKPENRWRGYNRQERMNHLGSELSRRAGGFPSALQHDTVLQPWQCGGPLLNTEGQAIGLNIARAGRVASYALPASVVQQAIADLKKSGQVPVKQLTTGEW